MNTNDCLPWELGLTKTEKENQVLIQKGRMTVRDFLQKQGFLEVEIPIVFPGRFFVYGGMPISGQIINGYLCAVMTPFIRRWLVLGKNIGVSKVYFIGKCFRDEIIDQNHYPIFENLAVGVRGQSYRFLMELTEGLIAKLADVFGKTESLSWRYIPYLLLEPKTDFMVAKIDEQEALAEYSRLTATLKNPTFVTELPTQLFGPARKASHYTKERAELFIEGIEIGNISTFLTDPTELARWYGEKNIDFDQYRLEREHLQSVSSLNGELIATGAIGLSRLYMVLLGLQDIKQTIPFPYLGGVRK